VDLELFARRGRRGLVIKPNRLYGGKGVLIGARTSAAAWERALESALARPGAAVVQERVALKRMRLPPAPGPLYVVGGIHATEFGVALLARASPRPVVNIMRGGGIVAVLVRDARP
jgi:hypothetical protein